MLSAWLDDDSIRADLTAWSEELELDLVELGTTADAETITDTAVAQPLITAASIASYRALVAGLPSDAAANCAPAAAAGHSVGELAAAVVAGVLTGPDALRIVRERGLAMAEASAAAPTGMRAVVGGDAAEVDASIRAAGLSPANVNGGGQVVAAGTIAQLDELAANPPARARVVPLSVAGAFHTEHMAPAQERVRAVVDSVTPQDPTLALLSNRDGAAVTSGADALERIVGQVTSPVRWDLCSRTLLDLGVTGAIELCPGGVLAGLAKRTLKGVEVVALTHPADLDAARDLFVRHGGTS